MLKVRFMKSSESPVACGEDFFERRATCLSFSVWMGTRWQYAVQEYIQHRMDESMRIGGALIIDNFEGVQTAV